MMDEEIRQAVSEVREMKQMCGNINMKLTNIVTQRGQDIQKKLNAEYQRGFEDGKAVNDRGCEGCRFTVMGSDTTICAQCCNAYHNMWTAKDTYYDIIRNSIHNWATELNVKLEDISKVLEDMKHD